MKAIDQAAQEAWAKIGEVAKDTGNDCIFFAFDNGYFIICDALRPFAEEIARLASELDRRDEAEASRNDDFVREIQARDLQLAATKEVLREFEQWQGEVIPVHNDEFFKASDVRTHARKALATPCPAADALVQDRARLQAIQDYGADNDIYAEPDGKWSIRERSGERTLFPNISECADCLIAAARKEGPQ